MAVTDNSIPCPRCEGEKADCSHCGGTGRAPRIAAAALRTQAGEVVSLPAPARHWHVIQHMSAKGYSQADIARADQGFVTEGGQWVRRAPALRIAQDAGQLVQQTHPRELFTEDLW